MRTRERNKLKGISEWDTGHGTKIVFLSGITPKLERGREKQSKRGEVLDVCDRYAGFRWLVNDSAVVRRALRWGCVRCTGLIMVQRGRKSGRIGWILNNEEEGGCRSDTEKNTTTKTYI